MILFLLQVRLDETSQPIEYFQLFFDDEVVQRIADKTDEVTQARITKLDEAGKVKPRSRFRKWKTPDADKIYRLLGVLINMGLVQLPSLSDYWSKDWTCATPFFSEAFASRDEFSLLFYNLHLVSDPQPNETRSRTDKVQWLIDNLNRKFQKYYDVDEKIAVDESVVLFKGRVMFRQYLPNKRYSGRVQGTQTKA